MLGDVLPQNHPASVARIRAWQVETSRSTPQPSATKARNQVPPERELPRESSYLWRGGRDSKAQLPAVSARKRKGRDR